MAPLCGRISDSLHRAAAGRSSLVFRAAVTLYESLVIATMQGITFRLVNQQHDFARNGV